MQYLSFSWPLADAGLIHEHKNFDWINWWSDDGLQEWLNYAQDSVHGILPRSIWPVKTKGQMIGTCNSLVDLAIDSGSHMTIWAFSNSGVAKVWKIDDGSDNIVERRWVVRDGTVRESGVDGDIEMSEAPPSAPDTLFLLCLLNKKPSTAPHHQRLLFLQSFQLGLRDAIALIGASTRFVMMLK